MYLFSKQFPELCKPLLIITESSHLLVTAFCLVEYENSEIFCLDTLCVCYTSDFCG